MRKNNTELVSQVLGFRNLKDKCVEINELRKMNAELESEVLGLMMIPGKWMLKEKLEEESLLCVLEGERNTLVALVSKDDELEEKVKRNLITIDELRKQNRKLEDEKCKYEKMVESLNGDICHSLGATAATAQPLSKGIKDERGSSLARGRKESKKVIEIIDLDDDDDKVDECTSRVLHVKKAGFGITVKTEYPSSSVEPQQEHSFSKQSLEIIRKISFSSRDTSASSDTSSISFYLEDLPISPAQLQAKRRKT